jgi:hypothetical protein
MSVILTLMATLTGDGAMTSTTSGIALTDILKGAIIASIALVASLVATELLSLREGRGFPFRYSKKAAEAVLGINVTLLLIFFISVAFNVTRLS